MAKQCTPEEAAALLRPADQVSFGLGPSQPVGFLHALGTRDDWTDLLLLGALVTDFYAVMHQPGVRYLTGFFGPIERWLCDEGANVEFVPADFRRFGPLLEEQAPRVVACAGALPDSEGYVSFSLHSGATVQEQTRAARDPERLLVVEVSPNYPRTYGLGTDYPHRIHVDDIDVLIETDRSPIEIGDAPSSEVEQAIARIAAGFISDGATLQTGIGGIPSTIAQLLAEGSGGGYGVHSEMFTTGLMHLHRAGKVTNDHKGAFDGFSVTTFAAGTKELYEWLHENREVRFLPVGIINSPELISTNRQMVSINGALAVDLHGQVAADTRGGRQFSGIGGHEDFVASSGFELEDRSLICLPATANGPDGPISRIRPVLGDDFTVTTPRHQVDVIVTEFGAAELRGRTVRERAEAMAAIAHPDFRDELLAAVPTR